MGMLPAGWSQPQTQGIAATLGLTARQAEVLRLRYAQGMVLTAIAEMLDLSHNRVEAIITQINKACVRRGYPKPTLPDNAEHVPGGDARQLSVARPDL